MPDRRAHRHLLPVETVEQRTNAAASARVALAKPEESDAITTSRTARLDLLERENAQLRGALTSRIVIEQAKGVLAERFRLDADQAFELLRHCARSNRMSIHSLAAAVTPLGSTPAEIEEVVLRLMGADGSARARGRLQQADG